MPPLSITVVQIPHMTGACTELVPRKSLLRGGGAEIGRLYRGFFLEDWMLGSVVVVVRACMELFPRNNGWMLTFCFVPNGAIAATP